MYLSDWKEEVVVGGASWESGGYEYLPQRGWDTGWLDEPLK